MQLKGMVIIERNIYIDESDWGVWMWVDTLLAEMDPVSFSHLLTEGLKKEMERRLLKSIDGKPAGQIEYSYRDDKHIRRTKIFRGKWLVYKYRSADPYYGEDRYSVAWTEGGQIIVFSYAEKLDAELCELHPTYDSFAVAGYPNWVKEPVADILYPNCTEDFDI